MKIQRYEVIVTHNDDNSISINRTNDGFNAYELLGLLEHTQLDILKQISGEIKPKHIKRNYIDQEPENTKP